MAENKLNFIFGADVSEFQNAIKTVNEKLKQTGDKMKQIGSDLSTYVSLPLAALGGAAIKAFGDIQALQNGLTAVTGDAKETAIQFERLKELAKLPGLGLQEVTKGSVNLQVIGFTAEKAEKSIKAFGNAVATVGGGAEQFDRALYGLAQLANTDFPLGEDLNIIKDAIPQVTPLLKEAFGSARSDELKELGISSQQVVDTIVNGLSKLPPVAGGVNNAFENLKDGVFQNLAEVGKIINDNLNLNELSDKIVSGISSIVGWFKELDPTIQRFILGFAGIAIVLPPIIAALGVFIGTVLPALTAGFAALISPVGLIVVGIAAAVAAIIAYWDEIKEYFTSGEGNEFWQTVKTYANYLWESLKSIFNSIKSFVLEVWSTIGTNVIAYVKSSFGYVQSIIKTVLGVISGVFKVFASVLKGDWSGAWEGVKDIAIALWNGILGVVKNGIAMVSNALASFFKLIGANGLAAGIEAGNSKISKLFDNITIPIKKAKEEVKDFNKELTNVGNSPSKSAKAVTNAAATDKDNAEKIADVYKDLEIGLKQIDAQFGITFGEKAKKRIDEYQQAINGLIKNGVDPLSSAIKKLQAEQQKNVQLETHKTPEITQKNNVPQATLKLIPASAIAGLNEQKNKIVKMMDEMNTSITSSINSSVAAMASGFVEMVGQMATGQMSMGDVMLSLIGMLGDMAIQIGKIAISTGIAMMGIKAAFSNPVTAIAAGVALVALGSMVKGHISKVMSGNSAGGGKAPKAFAKGGIVSSPTNAIFGEYPSAGRGNPEIVAPLNNLKSMLGSNDGMNGNVKFEIQGDTLVGVLERYDKRQYRTR
jgi:tape measure domain-containing protein